MPVPAAPSAPTVGAQTVSTALSWTAVATATSYKVMRDGSLLSSPTNTAYTDAASPIGSHNYTIIATNGSGDSVAGPAALASGGAQAAPYPVTLSTVDANGSAVGTVTLVATGAAANTFSGTSDAGGLLSLNLFADEYAITATKAGYVNKTAKFSCRGPGNETISLLASTGGATFSVKAQGLTLPRQFDSAIWTFTPDCQTVFGSPSELKIGGKSPISATIQSATTVFCRYSAAVNVGDVWSVASTPSCITVPGGGAFSTPGSNTVS